MPNKALVIGGNGFIGSHLVDLLLARGWIVTVLDCRSERYRPPLSGVKYHMGDFGNPDTLEDVLGGQDVIFHLACTTIPGTSNRDMVFDVSSNVIPSIRLFELCVQFDVGRVVFMSSGGTVYGATRNIPISEDAPRNPTCSYGTTKLMIEKYLQVFHHLWGLEYRILRAANAFGERQDYAGQQGAITVFLGCVARHKPIHIWGNGEVVKDFLYVRDLARALLLAATTSTQERIFNIASGEGRSLNSIIATIREIVALPVEVVYEPARPVDVPVSVLDISRARMHLHWQPEFDFREAVERTWRWVRAQVDSRGQGGLDPETIDALPRHRVAQS